jgi:putative transposase
MAGRGCSIPRPIPGIGFWPKSSATAVWLYHVFSLSLRDVELILAERGIVDDP